MRSSLFFIFLSTTSFALGDAIAPSLKKDCDIPRFVSERFDSEWSTLHDSALDLYKSQLADQFASCYEKLSRADLVSCNFKDIQHFSVPFTWQFSKRQMDGVVDPAYKKYLVALGSRIRACFQRKYLTQIVQGSAGIFYVLERVMRELVNIGVLPTDSILEVDRNFGFRHDPGAWTDYLELNSLILSYDTEELRPKLIDKK